MANFFFFFFFFSINNSFNRDPYFSIDRILCLENSLLLIAFSNFRFFESQSKVTRGMGRIIYIYKKKADPPNEDQLTWHVITAYR